VGPGDPNKVEAGPRTPRQEYAERRAERQRRAADLDRRERGIAYARVAVFLAGLALAALAFGAHVVSGWWLVLPAVAFSALLVLHEKVTRALHRARRAVAFYDAGLTRLEDAWRGQGQAGTRFLDENHPYASDLDLFGPGSLFELLCTARTRTGEDTLAAWLKAPAGPDEVRARQAAVAELRPELDLREELALLGGDLPSGVDFHAVAEWGAAPPVLTARWPRLVALALGALALVTLAGWLLALVGAVGEGSAFGAFFVRHGSDPFAIALLLEGGFALWLYGRVRRVLEVVERRGRDLALLASVLACLERFPFTSPRLRELHTVLLPAERHALTAAPSQRIAQLGNLLDLLNSRRNQFFAPIAYLMLWGTQMAHAIEAWRAKSGPRIAAWLNVVGQFEALCALASYGYENPADPFPEVVSGDASYEGEGLGHPLIPEARCVRNDLRLASGLRVLVVSGSNMSGKSTFLRTVGVNAVLALAGAPVRARRMRLTPLAVGATLRIQDSLQAGRSRFYAEVLRVRQVVDISRGPVPLLFLLDEIFAGTNSHDRRLGAEAVVAGLVDAGALGLVTTHDLALTHVADQLGARAANVHFADHFEHGEMKFDYTLRPGVVQNSNALALMRAVGLRV
jgi:hypothetical protein